jgi:integrase
MCQIVAAMKPLKQTVYPCILQTAHGKVKIYKNGVAENPVYIVSYITVDGRKREGFRDEERAHNRAEEILDDLKKGMTFRKEITSEKALLYKEYEKLLAEQGSNIGAAVRFFLEHKTKEGATKAMPEVAVTEYLKKFDPQSRQGRAVKSILQGFVRHFRKTLCSISVKELDSYIRGISDRGRTRNNHLGCLKAFFKWAQEWRGYLPEGRLEINKIEGKYPETNDPIEIFTPEEMVRILASAPNRMIPYVAIGAFTGMRSAEVCRLKWEDIRMDQKVIECSERITKTKRRRLVPMTNNLIKWLEKYEGEKTGLVSPCPHSIHNKCVPELAKKAGVVWKKNGLRKSYISYSMASPTADAAIVAKHCGNSPAIVETVYKQLAMPDTAAEWFNIVPSEK